MNVEKLLFIDTETNEDTQDIDCITYLIGDKKGIIEEFNEKSYMFLRDLWYSSEGVVFFNAPFDMGVLSKAYKYNGFKWVEKEDNETGVVSSYWDMLLFGCRYKVKKLSKKANFIQPINRKNVIPIIDLLKLWDILIDSKNKIGLKVLIERHLNWGDKIIPYSKENAKLEEYRYQDVIAPKELMYIFLDKIKNVDILNDFSAVEWGSIKSSATFSKLFYTREYNDLKEWQKENDINISKYKLSAALEKAYHGGLTFAFYRGHINNCAWVDIKGAYANTMQFLNTDQYLKFDFEKVDVFDMNSPYLLYVKSNFIMDTIDNGLKIFYTYKFSNNWIWNYDIEAIKNLIDDYEYEIIEIYKIIPKNDVKESLPLIWNNLKNIEEINNGKSTLYNFYKLLSNSSYGIKAQRIPRRTIHSNMIIAGIVTSRAHLILATINKVLRDEGFKVVYNDTDSACFHFDINTIDNPFDVSIINKINTAIHPFEVDYEGVFFNNIILSLKRYICEESQMFKNINIKLIGKIPDSKIRVHGKGQYDITADEMHEIACGAELEKDRLLNIYQFVGTTKRTMKRIIYRFPKFKSNLRPFMFITNEKSTVWLSTYLKEWAVHIDKKLTCKHIENYDRKFIKFLNRDQAVIFYKNIARKKVSLYGSNMTNTFIDWDATEKELSEEVIDGINNTDIVIVKEGMYIDPFVDEYCNKCGDGLVVGKNISANRYNKSHVYLCDKCFIKKVGDKCRTKNEINKEKGKMQKRIFKKIERFNENKNKSQEQTMKEIEQEDKDNAKKVKEIKKRLADKETKYCNKMDKRKLDKQNKKPRTERKIKKDEKKYCKRCNVLLNPYINGNITMRDYKAYKYLCLNCKINLRDEKRLIKNSR